MKPQPKRPKRSPTQNTTQRKRLRNLVKQAKKASKMVRISLDVPSRHYDVVKEVANLLQCTPEAVF